MYQVINWCEFSEMYETRAFLIWTKILTLIRTALYHSWLFLLMFLFLIVADWSNQVIKSGRLAADYDGLATKLCETIDLKKVPS